MREQEIERKYEELIIEDSYVEKLHKKCIEKNKYQGTQERVLRPVGRIIERQ